MLLIPQVLQNMQNVQSQAVDPAEIFRQEMATNFELPQFKHQRKIDCCSIAVVGAHATVQELVRFR